MESSAKLKINVAEVFAADVSTVLYGLQNI